MKRFVAYYRVSTDKQGRSGLGLEAQKEAATRYLASQCGHLIQEYVEVESGKRSDRPQLSAALVACKKQHATLLIAKLDRLARSVHFISGLMEGGVEFVAVDNPHANRLMLHLLAAFAEHERELISQRTKDALKAAKARGVKLGTNGVLLARRNKEEATRTAEALRHFVDEVWSTGVRSNSGVANKLNTMGLPTSRGNGKWHPMTASRLLDRLYGAERQYAPPVQKRPLWWVPADEEIGRPSSSILHPGAPST